MNEAATNAVNQATDRAETAERNAKVSEEAAAEHAKKAEGIVTELDAAREKALKSIDDKKVEGVNAVEKQKETSKQSVTEHTDREILRVTQKANEISNSLNKSITEASNKKSALDESVNVSAETKKQLDLSIESGKNTKADLDQSIENSTNAKSNLDGSVAETNTIKTELTEAIETASTLDGSLGIKIEEGKQVAKKIVASGEKAVEDINTTGAEKLKAMQDIAAEFAADREQIGTNKNNISSLKEDIYNQVEKTLSNNEFDWQSGWYEPDGTIHNHEWFKHSKVFKTVQGSTITFKNLRAPANYIACIACFSGGKYMHDVSLKGDSYMDFSSGTFTVPENVDGVSFISYVDGLNEITVKLVAIEAKSDSHEEKIESIKNNIQHMESDIAGNCNQIYNIKKYTITDGIDIKGSYYDKNGKLQPADNLSTTGIFTIPYGIKSITYTAFRNIDIPTILFLSADMKAAGMVIATTEPTYGDEMYSGIAEIPSNAVYMEFSVLNTNNDSSVTVTYSNIESNQKRIEMLEKDPLYGMKISCTGNSITAATHSVPGHGYVEQIADAHGMTVDNHAIWGAIIPQGHPRASDGVTDIGCIHDTLDDMDADADIVIMSGSINDCEYYSDASFLGEITGDFSTELDLTTFYGALEDMCKKALQKWAGKPIIYVIEHRMTLDNTTYGQYYLKLHEAIVKVMNKWGISIVDLFNDCPSLNCNEGYKTKYTTGDGTHPNYEGYEMFYVPRVYAEIKKLLGI